MCVKHHELGENTVYALIERQTNSIEKPAVLLQIKINFEELSHLSYTLGC